MQRTYKPTKVKKHANPELANRMRQIAFSGASGVHADQNYKKYTRNSRRQNRQEERNACTEY